MTPPFLRESLFESPNPPFPIFPVDVPVPAPDIDVVVVVVPAPAPAPAPPMIAVPPPPVVACVELGKPSEGGGGTKAARQRAAEAVARRARRVRAMKRAHWTAIQTALAR